MICAYDKCKKDFTPKTHNQKYCSDECCRIATNIKIKEKYYENKARLNGALRICKAKGCTTRLSRYNEDIYCAKCIAKKETKERKDILRLFDDIG